MRKLASAALFAALPAAAHAHEQDLQQWTLLVAQGSIKNDLLVYAEVQPRLTDDAERLGQILIRPAIGYRINADTNIHVGYAYVRTEPAGGVATDEHRIWQQLVWPVARAGGLSVNARTRLEQRSIVGSDDLGWRLRQQVRAQAPVSASSQLQGVIWTEPFYNVNSTDWGAREGLERWRTFVGVTAPVAKGLTFEPGYLNQTVFRSGEDQMHHVVSANMFYRF